MINNKEFIINLGNCQGLVYKFQGNELLVRYKNSDLWFKSQNIIKKYILNNLSLVIYLENDDERS